MTIAELDRALASKVRVEKVRAQEKASFDYILADLFGRSVGRLYSSSTKIPEIHEVYPSLFSSEDVQQKQQEQIDKLSALRFKQYANFHNNRFNKEVANVK